MIPTLHRPALTLLCLGTILVTGPCRPVRAQPIYPDPWAACSQAAAMAEQEGGIPPGLLLAIGKVESGRVHPNTGRVVPWPFALNIAGRGVYPVSAEAAVAEVRAAQAGGTRSIDVGCFQINLLHHPYAFPTLDDAFDPARNAAYAAHFLQTLRARLPSWELAAGGYHSMTPMFAEPYAARVAAAWSGAGAAVQAAVRLISFRVTALPQIRVYAPGTADAGIWPGAAYVTNGQCPSFTAQPAGEKSSADRGTGS